MAGGRAAFGVLVIGASLCVCARACACALRVCVCVCARACAVLAGGQVRAAMASGKAVFVTPGRKETERSESPGPGHH